MSASDRIQRHAPYRGVLLPTAMLETLSRPWPARVIADTFLRWGLIVTGWLLAARLDHPLVTALVIVWAGINFYALFIVGHDGMHRRLFGSERLNDLWADLFILAPMGAVTRLNRLNHMRHHAFLGLESDPDRYKYERDPSRSDLRFWAEASGVPMVFRVAANVFAPAGAAGSRSSSARRRCLRDWLILLGVNGALISALTVLFGWWGYPLMWLLPVYVFVYAADLMRTYLEHALLPGEESNAQRLVSFDAPWWERQLLAPMNMNFHLAHHLYPAIPYHRLPAADALIRLSEPLYPELLRRRSYLRHLWALFLANRAQRTSSHRVLA